MDVTLLKILLIIVMGAVPVIFGLLPIKVLAWLARKEGNRRLSSLLLSMLSCFAGGVILGVCFIELLPEAREDLEKAQETNGWDTTSHPWAEILVAVGFFLVYFVEEFIGAVCGHEHDHGDNQSTKSVVSDDPEKNSNISVISCTTTASDAPIAPATPSTCDTESVTTETIVDEKPQTPKAHRKAVIEAVTFVLALIVHTSLEGFAFGVQQEITGITSLFFGIVVHKALVSFSVGMTLVRALPHNLKLVVGLIALLACFTPLGGVIGLALQNADLPGKDGVSAVLTCVSIGTFLFIAFFEILAPERLNDHSNLLQWVACAGGFTVMAVALSLGDGHSHSGGSGHAHAHE